MSRLLLNYDWPMTAADRLRQRLRAVGADSATNLREAADFETPDPGAAGTSPSGSRTAQPNRSVDTMISIRFIAQRPSQSSCAAVSQLGIVTCGRPCPGPAGVQPRSCRRGSQSVPRSAPTVRPPRRVATVARPAGRRDIRPHHRAERLDPCRKTEPIEACRQRTSLCDVSRHGVALPCGISTPSLAGQGG